MTTLAGLLVVANRLFFGFQKVLSNAIPGYIRPGRSSYLQRNACVLHSQLSTPPSTVCYHVVQKNMTTLAGLLARWQIVFSFGFKRSFVT